MAKPISVGIPVRNGAAFLDQTLAAIAVQKLDPSVSVELLVCDSGSRDGSTAVARSYGAEVIEIPPQEFSHGGTRNLLMERSQGAHVAFLTQDAIPADERWLGRLLEGFAMAENVGLVFGPYRPRPDASPMVARELSDWFRAFSPTGVPRIDRLHELERQISPRELLGPRGFYTDANGCIARAAWEVVPFRSFAYAEDHVLAHDMLRAGFAKVYLPEAEVVHSHEYSGWNWLRRSFDEARGLAEVYGHLEPLELRATTLKVWGSVGADWRWTAHERNRSTSLLARSACHHGMRTLGAILGARAARLPTQVVRRLSLEGRA